MKGRFVGVVVAVWAAAILAGMIALTRYSLSPGTLAAAPASWPAASTVERTTPLPQLVMIAHPRCACTRASLGELAVLMAHCAGRVLATVIFVRPDGVPAGWENTDLLQSARAIPGVTVLTDAGGREAARFGAATSGQVLLYDAAGRLAFCGGITAGRGHAGDNAGREALEALLRGAPARASVPVFGCELFDPHATRRAEVAPTCRN